MAELRALIVDDEPLAREKLRTLLAQEQDIEIVGECSNGSQALAMIDDEQPDLIFLDVQMPEMDGFEVLSQLPEDRRPMVVFVTAYDKYALRAFEVCATDYILKPFDRERLRRALEVVRSRRTAGAQGGFTAELNALLEHLRKERRLPERIAIRSSGRVFFLRPAEIDWVEAAGNYVRLHVGPNTYTLRHTMSSVEQRLSETQFLRIHRSSIVNLERIRQLEPLPSGEYTVTLVDNTKLTLSRGYRDKVSQLLSDFG